MIWGSPRYDRPIHHGKTQCRAFITTERDGYFYRANDDFHSLEVRTLGLRVFAQLYQRAGRDCVGISITGAATADMTFAISRTAADDSPNAACKPACSEKDNDRCDDALPIHNRSSRDTSTAQKKFVPT